jgi:putative restriction endonuclease
MVKIFVGVTHKPWFDFLSGIEPDEVNFWQPSGSSEFRALKPGDLFLFKLKAPYNVIAGGGVFGHASIAPLSLAWEAFGEKNGSATKADMRKTIVALRRESAPLGEREDPTIGCRILTEPFFWPQHLWFAPPANFSPQTVVGKGYEASEPEGRYLWDAVAERLAATPTSRAAEPQERYGGPIPMRRRLGQGAFRLTVTDAYNRRCAVSGEKTLPILDAAHIRSYTEGGEHEVSNGLLLRTDIHRLFDLGYVTVTGNNRFAVSERLKADFDNGAHYYAMQGQEIARPLTGFAPPSHAELSWHREYCYLG